MRSRTTAVSRLAAGVAVAGVLVFAAPGQPADERRPMHPRQVIFSSSAAQLVDEFSNSARLTVLFHPDTGQCEPQHIQIMMAMRRLLAEHSDIQVLTVLPAANAQLKTLLGEKLPGRIVSLDNPSYVVEGRLSPRPRLEVWSRDGRLLLLRSIPLVANEDSIYQEVLWALAFTAPVEQ